MRAAESPAIAAMTWGGPLRPLHHVVTPVSSVTPVLVGGWFVNPPIDSYLRRVSRARFSATRRRVVPAALLCAVLAASALTIQAPQSAANQVGDLKAQAKAIAEKLVQEQLQIDAYQQQYSVDSAKVAADAQAIADVDAQLAQDQVQIRRRHRPGPRAGHHVVHERRRAHRLRIAALFEGNAGGGAVGHRVRLHRHRQHRDRTRTNSRTRRTHWQSQQACTRASSRPRTSRIRRCRRPWRSARPTATEQSLAVRTEPRNRTTRRSCGGTG